jgi:iron-sulfur cluster repair protein YtfE (RIC family)
MDAIDLLTHQHRILERCIQAAADATDDRQRAAALVQAADELSAHLTSEEEVFYPAVNARRTEDILLESLEEHLSLKRVMADLLALPPDARTYEAKLHVLKEQAEHHHKEEEQHLFPKVLALLDTGERQRLGQEMQALQQCLLRQGSPSEQVAEQTDRAAPLE